MYVKCKKSENNAADNDAEEIILALWFGIDNLFCEALLVVYDHHWSSTGDKTEDENDKNSRFLHFKSLIKNTHIFSLRIFLKSNPSELLVMDEILIFFMIALDSVF